MLAEVLEAIETRQGGLSIGDKIDISENIARKLGSKIRWLNQIERPRIENGELKLLHPANNLADIIVGLTENDLQLQKQLLLKHCQQYSPKTHFWRIKEQWEEKAAILEYDAGMNREEAEHEAAKMYHLLAFMDELLAESD